MAGASQELLNKEKETIEERETKQEKKEGYIFKSKIPNLYLFASNIRFRKGEYITKDKKEAEILRKMKNIEEVTQK